MFVESLSLHNFRSYSNVECDFGPGINILIGPNGVGKTNLVEAIRYASTLSSHRVASDAPLRQAEEDSAVVRVRMKRNQRSLDLELSINAGRQNRLQIAGSPTRSRDFVGQLRTVMFSPEDLGIVKGDPAGRRDYLDDVLIQRAPRYLGVKSDYDRVVRQRSSLLKTMYSKRGSATSDDVASTLAVWDEQLVMTGAALLYGRLRVLDELSGPIVSAYHDISNGSVAHVEYFAKSVANGQQELPRDKDALEAVLRDALVRKRPEELARGLTLVGPQRDDIIFTIDALPAKTHASHGEGWSLALALRLASFTLLRQFDEAGDPVLILDDVFAELDTHRRMALKLVADTAEQVFVTAAVADDVPDFDKAAHYEVSPGEVRHVEL